MARCRCPEAAPLQVVLVAVDEPVRRVGEPHGPGIRAPAEAVGHRQPVAGPASRRGPGSSRYSVPVPGVIRDSIVPAHARPRGSHFASLKRRSGRFSEEIEQHEPAAVTSKAGEAHRIGEQPAPVGSRHRGPDGMAELERSPRSARGRRGEHYARKDVDPDQASVRGVPQRRLAKRGPGIDEQRGVERPGCHRRYRSISGAGCAGLEVALLGLPQEPGLEVEQLPCPARSNGAVRPGKADRRGTSGWYTASSCSVG